MKYNWVIVYESHVEISLIFGILYLTRINETHVLDRKLKKYVVYYFIRFSNDSSYDLCTLFTPVKAAFYMVGGELCRHGRSQLEMNAAFSSFPVSDHCLGWEVFRTLYKKKLWLPRLWFRL